MNDTINPEITALRTLQKQDRRLTVLERRLAAIPTRVKELDGDLATLEQMLDTERGKLEETRAFQKRQEDQLLEEEDLIRQSKARLGQVKNTREYNATKREVDSTREMMNARTKEIEKLKGAVAETEARIAKMATALEELRAAGIDENKRLSVNQAKYEKAINKAKSSRTSLTKNIERSILRTYERIRRRTGGLAFVAAHRERCTACKMVIPHIIYMQLLKGKEILPCESCSRLLYWSGHFPEDKKKHEPKPKAAV